VPEDWGWGLSQTLPKPAMTSFCDHRHSRSNRSQGARSAHTSYASSMFCFICSTGSPSHHGWRQQWSGAGERLNEDEQSGSIKTSMTSPCFDCAKAGVPEMGCCSSRLGHPGVTHTCQGTLPIGHLSHASPAGPANAAVYSCGSWPRAVEKKMDAVNNVPENHLA